MLCNIILYIIALYIKSISIINKKYKIISNGLINILKVFCQLIIYNILRIIMKISKIRIYYYIFFNNFYNISISINRVEGARFSNLRYRKENLYS